ncbi:MAG: transcriptional repressor [Treponema sp.]|jgi:Fur family peroxide stress response transcriptional regulator|nr:transcriptional repressor [Treponema sp.]
MLSGSSRKHSKKRDAVLQAILSTKTHPGASWVYRRLKPHIPGLSLGTVYRNISVLREEGAVISVGVVDGEERFDGRKASHPHFVCERCGCVKDFTKKAESAISSKISIEIPGFVIDNRKTVFYGLCKTCAGSPTAPAHGD